MPGFVWNGEEARKIAYLWAKKGVEIVKPILRAWVWDGETAVLWYQRETVPPLVRTKWWPALVAFTEEEFVERHTIKGEQDGFTVVGVWFPEFQPRDHSRSWAALASFTELERRGEEVVVGEEDGFSVAEDIQRTPEDRDQSRGWGEGVGFTDDEDVDVTVLGPSAPPTYLVLADVSACAYGDPDPDYGVEIDWNSGDATASTRIYRQSALLHTVGPGVETWTDPSPLVDTNAHYEVCHYKDGIESSRIEDWIEVGGLICGPTATPTCVAEDLTSCAGCVADLRIGVTAGRVGDTISDLFVDRSVNMGEWSQVAIVSFEDTDLRLGKAFTWHEEVAFNDQESLLKNGSGPTVVPGITVYPAAPSCSYDDVNYGYRYRTRLVYNGVTTTSAVTGSITIYEPCAVPDIPEFTVAPISATVLRITVSPVPDGALYHVYRAPNYGAGQHIAALEPGNLVHDDTGRSPDTQYCYKVKVVNDVGCSSALSAEECASTWPLTPKNFSAVHDEAPCPTIRVDLSWSNGTRSELKTLQVYNFTTTSWDTISATIAAAATTYDDHLPSADHISEDSVQYRIKFNSESTWATDTVGVACPE